MRKYAIDAALLFTLCVLIALFLTAAARCEEIEKGCGSERMPVKTLSDSDVKLIQWQTIKQATVAEVIKYAPPPGVRLKTANDRRLAWEEKVVWQITGELVGFKLEGDQDIHVVIRDVRDHTKTMVVELVSENCIVDPYKRLTAQLRFVFEQTFGRATSKFKPSEPVRVVITGVGFYDFIHGQTGVAPNGFEIHPVTQIEVDEDEQ